LHIRDGKSDFVYDLFHPNSRFSPCDFKILFCEIRSIALETEEVNLFKFHAHFKLISMGQAG
jgi:hypothetical protein